MWTMVDLLPLLRRCCGGAVLRWEVGCKRFAGVYGVRIEILRTDTRWKNSTKCEV